MHYAADVAPRREAQCGRLGSWRCASEQEHVALVVDFIDACAVTASWGSVRVLHRIVVPPRLANAGPISISA
jgi:hypothetical protein